MVRDSLDQMDSDNTQNIPSKSNRTHRSYDVTPQKQVLINLKSYKTFKSVTRKKLENFTNVEIKQLMCQKQSNENENTT